MINTILIDLYLAKLSQPIKGNHLGNCVLNSIVRCMEARWIAQGGDGVRLSELDLYTNYRKLQGMFGTNLQGAWTNVATGYAETLGVCLESLRPSWDWVGPFGVPDYPAMILAMNTESGPAARADRPNHLITGWDYRYSWANKQEMIDFCKRHIDALHPLVIPYSLDHAVPAFGYNDLGFIGFDGRTLSPGTYSLAWDEVWKAGGEIYAVTQVAFLGSAPSTAYPVTPEQLAQLQTIWTEAMSLTITQEQWYTVNAVLQTIAGQPVTPPAPPPPTPTPPPAPPPPPVPTPPGDVAVPPPGEGIGNAITDQYGNSWSVKRESPYLIPLCNGVQFKGYSSAAQVIYTPNAVVASSTVTILFVNDSLAQVVFTDGKPTSTVYLRGPK